MDIRPRLIDSVHRGSITAATGVNPDNLAGLQGNSAWASPINLRFRCDGALLSDLRDKRAALIVERMSFERAVSNYALAIGTDTGEKVMEILKELNRAKANKNELTNRIDAIDAEIALSGGGTDALDTWSRIKALSASALVDKQPHKRQEVKTLLARLVKRIDLGRRDQENWWDSFPEWSMPYLTPFSAFSMRDPNEEDDFEDDENPGTPRKLSQEEKIIAAIEFWNGAKFLLRHKVVWPCHNFANGSS